MFPSQSPQQPWTPPGPPQPGPPQPNPSQPFPSAPSSFPAAPSPFPPGPFPSTPPQPAPMPSAPQQQPWGPPGAPSTFPGPPVPDAPKRSRKKLWISLGSIATVAVVAAGAGAFAYHAANTPEKQVRKTISKFAEAVDTANGPKMLSMMCKEQAQEVREGDDFDENDDSTVDPGNRRPVDISSVTVSGDTAQATVTRPPDVPHTYRLVKEDGSWKFCSTGPVSPQ